MNEISQQSFIESLKDRLLYLGKQFDTENEQVADLRHWYDDHGYTVTDELKKIDREIIERAEEIGNYIFDEGYYDEKMRSHWAWNPGLIATGEFPIEKIPEHVRELARNLYYK